MERRKRPGVRTLGGSGTDIHQGREAVGGAGRRLAPPLRLRSAAQGAAWIPALQARTHPDPEISPARPPAAETPGVRAEGPCPVPPGRPQGLEGSQAAAQ